MQAKVYTIYVDDEAWNTALKKSYNFFKEAKLRYKKQRKDIRKGWNNVQHTETIE